MRENRIVYESVKIPLAVEAAKLKIWGQFNVPNTVFHA